MCNLSITQVFDGYIGYVRRVTHDEIADAVGQNLREVPGTRTSLAVKARVILTPNLEINTLPVHRLPLAIEPFGGSKEARSMSCVEEPPKSHSASNTRFRVINSSSTRARPAWKSCSDIRSGLLKVIMKTDRLSAETTRAGTSQRPSWGSMNS